ncbi:hypothetical protein HHK36_014430 [Tetracentron sinense]|uniref:Ribosomal RNA-processing protein 12-like conserved domain-containing protein n=1 Tax=Tetracentron sinense TaxID=13715 RepID=A0A834Z8P8_TETSI|nr:hypothetical protein HHK36_014430 [Tetracentron sinense]
MEGLEMEETSYSLDESEDLCSSLLSRFSNSKQEDHQHLCAVIGAMSQELKDQKLPLSPIAYFGATISSLDRLSTASQPSDPVIAALLTLLSMILPRISVAILRKKRDFFSKLLLRILRPESATIPGVASGLKCISHLLIVGDNVIWSEIALLYGVLLGFITDSRPKVRKQSHLCLRDVLRSFQRSAMLAPASEGITNIFERFLLLAGGSNSNASQGKKGAQEVLYVMDALKDCLPLMSMKFTSSIMKYFKSLMELHQPLVTRRITDSLHVLCLHPTSEVAPDVLLDLLCSLSSSASANENSVDGMMFTARLLDVGIRKVYLLNRQICIVKLPIVFNALGEILACEHEEALFAAMEALKSLIEACIDESLIKQGVDHIAGDEDVDMRRSGPTIIGKICATIESLLGYRYNAVWDMALQVVSAMFNKLGENSSFLLRGTIKSLADMQKLSDEDLSCRKQLHECFGSVLGAIGPETFLSLLPLKLEAEDLFEANVWLLPILKKYTVGARLSFFTKSILGMVELIRQKARMLEQEGRIFSSRSTEALVYSLWSLLPSFCNYPVDTAESFKGLEEVLCSALHEEPDVCGIICSSLQILIQQNKRLLEEDSNLSNNEISIPEQRARAHYTPQVAGDNLSTLRSSAKKFFSVLSGIFLKSPKDSGGYLQSTIGEFASISDRAVVKSFFRTTMQKLLTVTQKSVKAEQPRNSSSMQIDDSANKNLPLLARGQLLDLAVSLLPGLDAKEVDLLFVAIKPALQDDQGLVQKKAYKILSIILRDRDVFLSTKLDDLLELMIEVLPSCHFSAKRYRLDCLYFLIVHVSKDAASEEMKSDNISSFLTEIILALKESNKKTRNRAYDILVQIGHAYRDEERGGKKENLQQFFNMVAGGLAGESPHMISAAVKGLARLAYEFSDLVSAAYNVLPSAFLLLQRKNREIIKANLGLVKVLVAKSQAEGLHTHLRSMVEGLLKWQDNTKNHFKAKVKLLLEMLVQKCGLDAVKAVMPEEHMKLLTNIRKIKERKERKIVSNSEEESRSLQSKATTSRLSRWNHTKIFSDFGNEETEDSDTEYMEAKTVSGRWSKASSLSKGSSLRSKQTRRASKSLPEDLFDQLEDDPLDLLDRQRTRSALRSSEHLKRKPESDDEPEIDSEGRLVIHEGERPKRETPSDPDSDARSQAGSRLSAKSSAKTQKRRKTSDSGWAYVGKEYASKKAGGDLKRKDKLEPYAYWPLDRKMMSRRPEHRAAARKGMASVVKLTKKLEGKSASSALSMKGLKFRRNQRKGSKKSR